MPSGVWNEEEYDKLKQYDGETWEQLDTQLFQCHQNELDDEKARLCAGWVGCHGQELMSLRLAVSAGRVEPTAMEYATDVPLFSSGTEAAEHGMAEIDDPGIEARILIEKIREKRSKRGRM